VPSNQASHAFNTMGFSDACWIPFLVAGMLVTGSINTLAKKIAYQTESEGESWTKPWTCTLIMFTGEFLCLIMFALKQKDLRWLTCARARSPAPPKYGYTSMDGANEVDDQSMNAAKRNAIGARYPGDATAAPALTLRNGLVCALPALCDVGGTTLSGIGLLFTTASVWQMLRGSIILFTGMLSVVFLKRKLDRFHYVGMAITIVGITIVGFASIYAPSTPLKENCCCTFDKDLKGILGSDDG